MYRADAFNQTGTIDMAFAVDNIQFDNICKMTLQFLLKAWKQGMYLPLFIYKTIKTMEKKKTCICKVWKKKYGSVSQRKK